jgi:PAS domain-containing protein
MCNTTARTSFLASRASTKLTEPLLSVRSRIAKKQAAAAAASVNIPSEQVSTPSSTTPISSSSTTSSSSPQQQQPITTNIASVATPANGYNLVEKKKRKVRCGKEAGPQDQFMFHLKLEQETKKKRKNSRRKAVAPTTVAAKPEEPQQQPQQPVHVVVKPPQPVSSQQQQPAITTVQVSPNTVITHQSATPMNGVITSIIEAIAQDNNVVPTIVTMVDGCVLKTNNALNKMLASSQGLMAPQRTMIQNMIHPEDMAIHHIQLLKLLASNTDTSRYELRLVNTDFRAIKTMIEVVCIRNDNALPQWLIIRVLSAMELNEFVRPDLMNQQQCNCTHHEQEAGMMKDLCTPTLSLDEMFLGVLERTLFKSQPALYVDAVGTIAWNNPAFDSLFGMSGRPFVGKQTLEISELKGTPIEMLSRVVLMDQQEKWEAQICPTNILALGPRALKINIQKISNNTDGTHGYLWMLSIVEEQARNESDRLTHQLISECVESQKKLQQQFAIVQQQQKFQPTQPPMVDEMVQDNNSPIHFLMSNDISCMIDERSLDNMFSSDKKFDYIDSNVVMYPVAASAQDLSGWNGYELPDQFFTDDVSETEIDSLFSSL